MSNILFDLILQPSSSKHVGYLSLMSSAHKNYDNKMTINKNIKAQGTSEPSKSLDKSSQSSKQNFCEKVNNCVS